jgi:hypothetical protein
VDLWQKRHQLLGSDSSIARVAGQVAVEEIRGLLEGLWRQWHQSNGPSVGVIDGSFIGGQWYSVLVERGSMPIFAGLEPLTKRGKELPVSVELIDRLAQQYGKGFVDYLLADGLYACESFWKACAAAQIHGIVKTQESGLVICQDAAWWFDQPFKVPGVEYHEGFDARRLCTYRLQALEDRSWGNTSITLKVVRVEETYLKGPRAGHTEQFWVLSQAQDLDARTLRHWAHERWFIENNGFKAFADQAHSKHIFSRDPHTAHVLSTWQLIGLMLISAYRLYIHQFATQFRCLWDHHQLSLRTLRFLLCQTGPLSYSTG